MKRNVFKTAKPPLLQAEFKTIPKRSAMQRQLTQFLDY